VAILPVLHKRVGDALLVYGVVQKKTERNLVYHIEAPVLQENILCKLAQSYSAYAQNAGSYADNIFMKAV